MTPSFTGAYVLGLLIYLKTFVLLCNSQVYKAPLCQLRLYLSTQLEISSDVLQTEAARLETAIVELERINWRHVSCFSRHIDSRCWRLKLQFLLTNRKRCITDQQSSTRDLIYDSTSVPHVAGATATSNIIKENPSRSR